MEILEKILDAGKELDSLSEKLAKKYGYVSSGAGGEGGSIGREEVVDASKRLQVSRGYEKVDPGYPGRSSVWGPGLSIDGKSVDLGLLRKKEFASLEKKLEKAFKPLLDALTREKREAPLREARRARAKERKDRIAQKMRARQSRKLIASLD